MLQRVVSPLGKFGFKENALLSEGIKGKLLESMEGSSNLQRVYPGVSAGVIQLVKAENDSNHFDVEFGNAVWGTRKNGSNIDIERNDCFHIGSCGQPITALVLEELIKENDSAFTWDTTVGSILKDIPKEWSDITLLDLMSQRSGIDDRITVQGLREDTLGISIDLLYQAYYRYSQSREKRLKQLWGTYIDEQRSLADMPLAERVKITRYSNMKILMQRSIPKDILQGVWHNSLFGVSLAASLAERYSGKPFETLVKELVCDPLDLNTIQFGLPKQVEGNEIVQPFGHNNAGIIQIKNKPMESSVEEYCFPELLNAASNYTCSTEDWLKVLASHLVTARTESPLPISYQGHVPIGDKNPNSAGCGWIVTDSKGEEKKSVTKFNENILESSDPEHSFVLANEGSNGQWVSMCAINVKKGFAIAVAANTFHARAYLNLRPVMETVVEVLLKEE